MSPLPTHLCGLGELLLLVVTGHLRKADVCLLISSKGPKIPKNPCTWALRRAFQRSTKALMRPHKRSHQSYGKAERISVCNEVKPRATWRSLMSTAGGTDDDARRQSRVRGPRSS